MARILVVKCIDCGIGRKVDTTKNNPEKYQEKHPRCNPCSKVGFSNPGTFVKGQKAWNEGRPYIELMKEDVGYDALHEWVDRWHDDPGECEQCSSTRYLEWSNRSGKYLRDLSDWQRLCKKCHHRYDFDKFGARKVFYNG